jgi:uncharacterized membrane protein YtjA (UPF0391 family)
MLRWALILFAVAIAAALFGYSGAAGVSAGAFEVVFFACIVLAIAMLVGALVSRGTHASR